MDPEHQIIAAIQECILIELTDFERAEILNAARQGSRRCRAAMVTLRLTDPQHDHEMREQLEETAKMWESLAASIEPALPKIESPPSHNADEGVPVDFSEIERTLGEK